MTRRPAGSATNTTAGNRSSVGRLPAILILLAAFFAAAGVSRQAIAQSWPSTVFGDVYQQTPVTQQCENGSYESGFAGWTGFRGRRVPGGGLPYENFVMSAGAPLLSTSCAAGPGIGNSGSGNTCHMIESTGSDPNLPSVSHPMSVAGASSLRIGGNDLTANISNGNAIEGVAKRFVVQASDAIYRFRYSSVMHRAHDSTTAYTGQEPYFQAIAIDPTTGAVIDKIDQPASGFNPLMVVSPDNSSIVYSIWSCAQLDLSSHIGQEVIVYFVNSDCAHGAHTAYTYVDDVCADCDGDDITIDDVETELKLCEPGKTTEIKGTFTVPPALNTSNVTVTIEIRQAGTTIGTLTGGTITGNTYSFPLSQADLNGLGCYDFVAVLEYDVTTPSGNVVHVRKETSAEGFKPGQDNDICVVDCPPPPDHTCLETEAEVACNPDGTVTVTVNSTSPAGFSGGTIEASTTTPGIVVLPAQQTLAPGQTQTQWVLSGPGVQAGQYVTLVIDQVDPGGGSKPGIDLCCSGEITIVIPDCPPIEVGEVIVEKKVVNNTHADSATIDALIFPIDLTCGFPSTLNVSFGLHDGGMHSENNVPYGSVCSVTEPTLPPVPPGVCEKGFTAVWAPPVISVTPSSATISASTPVITFTVVNELNCVKGDVGRLSITKLVSPDPNGIGNGMLFPATVTCTNPAASYPVTLHGNTSTVPISLPLGSQCSVTETLPPLPPGCTWLAPVFSPASVTIGGGVDILTVTNAYRCEPGKPIDVAIEKTGEYIPLPDMPPVGSSNLSFVLTVTNVGAGFAGANVITLTDVVPAGMTFNTATGTNWACVTLPVSAGGTMTCTYTGSGPTGPGAPLGTITIGALTTVNGPWENCASVGVGSAGVDSNPDDNKACVTVTEKPDGILTVEKKVDNRTEANLSGWQYPVTVTCAPSPNVSFNLVDGGSNSVSVALGASCTVSENVANVILPPSEKACREGLVPQWSVTISPAGLAHAGDTVVVENLLECVKPEKPETGTIALVKKVTNKTDADLSGWDYPVTVTCDPEPNASFNLADGGTDAVSGVPFGIDCKVGEDVSQIALPEKACPRGEEPRWSATISPNDYAHAGDTFVIENLLQCVKSEIVVPPPKPTATPDLSVEKSGPSTCEAGDTCRFTITVTNDGEGAFEGPLFVSDEVNIPGARVTAATNGWTCSGGTCVHATVMLAPGESETLRVDVLVPASARRNFELEQCAALETPEPGDTPIRFVQQMLSAAGIDVGAPDNQIGRKTRSGIEAFRKTAGLPGGAEIDDELLNALSGLVPADSNPDNNRDCAEARITKTIACGFGERLVGESCRDICTKRNSHWDGGKCVVCGGSLVWNQKSRTCVRRPTSRPTPTEEQEPDTIPEPGRPILPKLPNFQPEEPNIEPREPTCRFPQVFNPATGRCVGGEQQEEQEEEDKGDPENGGD